MGLFQYSVLKNHLKFLPKDKLEIAWQKFVEHFHNPIIQENIRASKEEQYQEGFLNDLFVNVFGYVKNPNPSFNLTTELKNIKNAKKTDGALLRRGNAFAVIELKGMDTTDLSRVETQAFGYKNNQADCNYVIISNFEKLRFYIDTTIEFEEFNLFTLTRERFEILYFCLSFETLLRDDKPKKAKEESINKEESITNALYKDYSNFRDDVFKNIQQLNPKYDKLTLFKKTQKLLDRFLFIFFAEDKLLLPPNLNTTIIEEWRCLEEIHDIKMPLYEKYKLYFNYLYVGKKNKKHAIFPYNGGLFATDKLLDSLKIDDALLLRHTQKISLYDFDSEVSVNILGHIFEHSMNEFEEIQAEIEGNEFEIQTTRRKKDGVFYTPKYITKYIVDNTVGKLCQEQKQELGLSEELLEKNYEIENGKSIKDKKISQELKSKIESYRNWLLELTICDPACGSGAFLNQALEFLITEHNYIYELELKLIGTALIDTELENKILQKNIFGVDINEESVEIAKLSLWLRTAHQGRKLTTLNENIKCGNSLIDDKEIAGEKAFNWKKEFPTVFKGKNSGFDVVIGNPPYVRADTEDTNFIKQRKFLDNSKEYETLYEKWDLMVPFYERGLKILKKSGYHGFIASNSISTSKYALRLQEWILATKNLISINYFEDIEVFKGVGVIPIITIIKNEPCNLEFYKIIHQKEFENQLVIHQKFSTKDDIKPIKVFKKNYVESNLKVDVDLLGDMCYISKGMVINADEKTAKGEFAKDDLISFVETEINTKPFIEGKDLKRYEIEQIKFLEWNTERVPSKLSRKTFPELYKGNKILRGAVTQGTFDNTGIICNHGVIVFKLYNDLKGLEQRSIENAIKRHNGHTRAEVEVISSHYDLKYILAILNSSYAMHFLNNIRRHRLKNYFYPDDFRKLPIARISKESQQTFIDLADKMLSLNEEFSSKKARFLRSLSNSFELEKMPKKLENFYELDFRGFLKELEKKKITLSLFKQEEWQDYFEANKKEVLTIYNQIQTTDKQIDNLVFELYGLSEAEIEIINNNK
ncbi:Eco57I restriction-modification methylase domain-containing protein [Bernardetia sp. OM2101]|uniref:Eco57I restriction-modification methylase domain-containing protein n=1 Tax=Bernardetia sp. OM2101 TaxID=3344876 RepID=UPI0035D017F1